MIPSAGFHRQHQWGPNSADNMQTFTEKDSIYPKVGDTPINWLVFTAKITGKSHDLHGKIHGFRWFEGSLFDQPIDPSDIGKLWSTIGCWCPWPAPKQIIHPQKWLTCRAWILTDFYGFLSYNVIRVLASRPSLLTLPNLEWTRKNTKENTSSSRKRKKN